MARAIKDSGIEWVGKIPEEWSVNPLLYAFNEKKHKNNGLAESNLLSLSYGRIIRKDSSDNMGLLPESFEGYNVIEEGNIVFRMADLQNDKVSLRSALVSERGIITSAYITIEKCRDISTRYFNYLFRAYDISKAYYNMGGGVRQGINYTELKKLPLIFPPLPVQKFIADYLDQKCALIDSIIKKQNAVIEKLKAYKQAVITEAVTKGLEPNAKMKPSGIEWIGEIPEEWGTIKIKFIKGREKNSFVDGPFGSNLKSEHFIENGDVFVIESNYATRGVLDERNLKTISQDHFNTISRSECVENDIIIAKIGEKFGVSNILPKLSKPSVVSGNSLKLTVASKHSFRFIWRALTAAKINYVIDLLVNSTGQPALTLSALNDVKIPMPESLEEEMNISNYLDHKCSKVENAITGKQNLIEMLAEYKKSLIYECVTGKREVI